MNIKSLLKPADIVIVSVDDSDWGAGSIILIQSKDLISLDRADDEDGNMEVEFKSTDKATHKVSIYDFYIIDTLNFAKKMTRWDNKTQAMITQVDLPF